MIHGKENAPAPAKNGVVHFAGLMLRTNLLRTDLLREFFVAIKIGETVGKRILLVALVLFAVESGNAAPKLEMSWMNPTYSGQRFKQILVIGMSHNLETRADFEVALASQITSHGINATAGTDILLRPTAGPLNLEYLREQIAAYNIDAVIVSRLVKTKTKVYIPGQPYFLPYYSTLFDYYGAMDPIVYSPDYLVKEKTVQVEINVYAVTPPNGELIWTGTTDSFTPGSAHKTINGVVQLIMKELEKVAILPEPAR
jgi:hypothetical protein